jgi:hypothetical protein
MAAMVELFCDSFAEVPRRIVLDIDDTEDRVHGRQQLSLFHAPGPRSPQPSVESREGAVAWAVAASLRFPCPLIKPDVRISRIRLSDWLHGKAHGGALRWTRRSRRTPSAPKIASAGKRLVPRDDTL